MTQPTLAFLDGLGGHTDIWSFQTAYFSGSYPVAPWSAWGYPPHPPSPSITLEELADRLEEYLKAIEARRAVLIGYSLGGMLALHMARHCPERVAGLVLIATSAAFGNREAPFQKAFLETWLGPLEAGRTMSEIAWQAVEMLASDAADPVGASLVRRTLARMPPALFRRHIELIAGFDMRAELPRIACPTLVVAGAQDPFAPPAMMERMAARLPSGRFALVEDAGHFVPFEQPEAVNGLIGAFLDEIPQRCRRKARAA